MKVSDELAYGVIGGMVGVLCGGGVAGVVLGRVSGGTSLFLMVGPIAAFVGGALGMYLGRYAASRRTK